ncbi:MAG: Y-family DNA polymerase [Chitinophagaceae bacterium]|nr:Y-family DNA polymerase [Chitinophagaceae bacterium]
MKAIVDCNSFYCSCEKVFKPELNNKPIVVLSNNDGCIISLNDDAKALGVKMTGPYYQAKPVIEKYNVAVFSSNYNLYGDMSQRVMQTLKMLTGEENVEVYSVDECFINLDHIPAAELCKFALHLKKTVEEWTGVAVSIGVAPTKVLCKVANRLSKKNKKETKGVMVLHNEQEIKHALQKTAVTDIWGVGTRYALKLQSNNINTAWELRNTNEEWGRKNLGGIVGVRLIKELCGDPCGEIKEPLKVKKMITTTRMFGKPVTELKYIKEAVATYISRAAEKLRRQSCSVKTVHVFVVTNDYADVYKYNPQTRGSRVILPVATSVTNNIIRYALPLVDKLFCEGSRYLKAGVIFSVLEPDDCIQSNLFSAAVKNTRHSLMETLDNINFSMRDDAVKFVSSGLTRNWKMRQELRSGRFTSRWEELKEVR